jgi:putative DNA primase/helicase
MSQPPASGTDLAAVAEAVPPRLRNTDQWVCWAERRRNGKPTKVPLAPDDDGYAATDDPATWASFDATLNRARDPDVDGVGFVFTGEDPFVGVDLDDCRNPETGSLTEQAGAIVTRLASYTEVSPSGTGLHVIARGELPDGRSRHDGVEMYADRRFFTVTGRRLEWLPERVCERPAELPAVHDEHVAEDERDPTGSTRDPSVDTEGVLTEGPQFDPELEDEELLERAKNAANGEKFEQLWRGDTSDYPSHSEADMALCCLLAFWTNCDPQRVDQLFRESGLMRDKWDEVHYAHGSTYGEKTVKRACRLVDSSLEEDAQ